MASSRSKQEPVFIGSRMITCRGSSKGQGREGPTEELIRLFKQRKTCFTPHRTHQDTREANISDSQPLGRRMPHTDKNYSINKNTKRDPISLDFREQQVETTMREHFTSTTRIYRMPKAIMKNCMVVYLKNRAWSYHYLFNFQAYRPHQHPIIKNRGLY